MSDTNMNNGITKVYASQEWVKENTVKSWNDLEDRPSYTGAEINEKLGMVDTLSEEIANNETRITALEQGGDAAIASIEPVEDDIPKVFFGGALQQTKTEAVVPFRYISKTQDISGYAEIKAQGNSSMSYPKKNQTVKLFKDAECTEKMKVDFKGWGKQNKHVYKANWIDLSHARNVVSARLWGDIVRSRSNYAELPEELRTSPNCGAVDGFPVKVYAEGVYQGRYTINIPKDKWMSNMDDDLDTHCILCGENYASGCFRAAANINGADWTDEIHDTVPTPIKTRWNEVISFVMNSTDDEFKANLGNYFDVTSLLDYYLFGLASCGLDAFGKNQLYMTYDGQKWIATMYDMDSTWGLYWNGSKFVATDYARTSYEDYTSTSASGEGNLLYNRLEQLFYAELQTRWAELKNGALSIENIINRFERFTDIASAELVKEDYASTTGGGKFTGIPSQATNNIQQIRAFALARQLWTDEYVAALTPEVEIPCESIALSASTLTFAAEGSQTLTVTVTPDGCTDTVTWVSDNTSIATVTDGIVTAVANGSCNITATCGNYSASCAVSVSGMSEAVECTGITLDKTELTFTAEGTQTLTATVTPDGCTDNVVWVSSAPSIAAIIVENNVCTVEAVANGNATITVTCGEYSASCTVAVSGITTKEYEAVVIRENFSPSGVSWLDMYPIDWANGEYIETEIDLSGCVNANENIFSLGTNISAFKDATGSCYHAYYTPSNGVLGVFLTRQTLEAINAVELTLTDNILRLKYNADGMFINGEQVQLQNDNDLIIATDNIQFGSKEGSSRSNAIYNYIKVMKVSSPDDAPLYPLTNGTAMDGDRVLTISNGNHVSYTADNAWVQTYANLHDINRNIEAGSLSAEATNAYSSTRFTLKAGDVVTLTKKNTVLTSTTDDAYNDVLQMISLRTKTTELKIISSNFAIKADATETKTITADYEVDGLIMWTHFLTNTVVEFDLELYVNGVRYV